MSIYQYTVVSFMPAYMHMHIYPFLYIYKIMMCDF